MPNPYTVRSRLGPLVLSVTAGLVVLAFGLFANGCQINKLLGHSSAPAAPTPLAVTPGVVNDSALAGTIDVRRASLEVNNGGHWSTTNDSPWIDVSPVSGTGRRTLTIALDPQGLEPGPHEGVVTVSASQSAGDPVVVPVTFVILQPVLSVSPMSISRTATSGNMQLRDTLAIANRGTGPLVWTAANKARWLTLETVSGVGDGFIPIRLSSSGLDEGTYKDTIVVTAVGAAASPARIVVTFKRRKNH
jgi:hypothetical protein